ncbi:hydantoinase B/oxoprolinase family protein [Microbacterium rhizophilus]|uniref:hydantoinase B/oxoprolinase family protein n=1 Tax=Microbacterium rhizophilus TaxID=3138934 RepID=UPI0031E83AFA
MTLLADAPTTAPDSIRVSVVRNRLDHITREMGQTMLRTARSPIFSEARDFVTVIFDAAGRKIAQTSYIPILVDATPTAMAEFIKVFGDDLHEGDIYVLNDPYQGNNHGPDLTFAKPVFVDGAHRYWTVSKAHMIDIGGRGVVGYNPLAETVRDEGMHFGPTRVYAGGVLNEEWLKLFLTNLTLPEVVEADLQACFGAVNVGERLLVALDRKQGGDVMDQIIVDMLASSEANIRDAIRAIPDGVYEGESIADNDGLTREPVRFHVKVTIAGDEIEFDLSGSDDQVPGYINSPLCNTASAISLAMYTCLDPDTPHSDSGVSAPITVIAREGSVANPLPPAPVVLCTTSGVEAIVEATTRALAQALGDRVPAGWSRMFIPNTAGFNPFTGRMFGEMHTIVRGGSGATPTADGYDTLGSVVSLGGMRATCPEMFELSTPFLLHAYEYTPDSGGAGEHRGGLGISADFEVLADDLRAVAWGAGELPETAAQGRAGGWAAAPNRHVIRTPEGEDKPFHPNAFLDIRKGDHFVISAGGGGGWGDPASRATAAVLSDVVAGIVSREQARAVYKVVVTENLAVDEAATEALRAA